MIWAWTKSFHRKTCTYNYPDLKKELPNTMLHKIPLSFIRRVSNHCDRFMSIYRLRIEGPLADYAMKIYRSHRCVTLEIIKSLDSDFELYTKNKESNKQGIRLTSTKTSSAINISKVNSKTIVVNSSSSIVNIKTVVSIIIEPINTLSDTLENVLMQLSDDVTFPIPSNEKIIIQDYIIFNWKTSRNTNIILTRLKNLHSDEKDFASLFLKQWLTGCIIQDFLDAVLYGEKYKSKNIPCYFLSNEFYFYLSHNNKYSYSCSHTEKLKNSHFYGDLLFVVHVPGHWLIAIISFVDKHIIVLDPISSAYKNSINISEYLKRFVVDEYKHRLNLDINISEWKISTSWSGLSFQDNSYSCGVFACVRLEYWCKYRRFPTNIEFKQSDDASFRLYITKRY